MWLGEREGGIGWEFGVRRCKLLYTEWMNNKVLLYSTRNHNGKEYKKMYTYV